MNSAFRFLYWSYRLLSELRYRIPRRLTRAGLGMFSGFMVVSLTGLDTENTVAYQAFGLLLFLLLSAVPFIFFFKPRFTASRLLPRFGTAGTPFSYRVVLTNLTPKTQRGLSLFENLSNAPSYREWLAEQLADRHWIRSFKLIRRRRTDAFRRPATQESMVPPVPPRLETEVKLELLPLRRGFLHFAGLILGRADPLGLIRSFVKIPLSERVLILPKRYSLPPIALPGNSRYQHGGVTFASNVGQSEEFIGLRDYRRGDPMRHIHWRSWAKASKPIVKEFEDEFFVRHGLVLDTFTGDPQSELFEEAVSVAASFACTVLTQESLLDLLFVGPHAYCFTAGRTLAQTDHILEVLACVRACGDKSFSTLESLVLDKSSALSGCICVFMAWDQPRQRLVEKLRAMDISVLVVVLTKPGQSQSMNPGPLQDEPKRFHVLELGNIERGLAAL